MLSLLIFPCGWPQASWRSLRPSRYLPLSQTLHGWSHDFPGRCGLIAVPNGVENRSGSKGWVSPSGAMRWSPLFGVFRVLSGIAVYIGNEVFQRISNMVAPYRSVQRGPRWCQFPEEGFGIIAACRRLWALRSQVRWESRACTYFLARVGGIIFMELVGSRNKGIFRMPFYVLLTSEV